MNNATQARCPECGHTLGLDPHVPGCGWAREQARLMQNAASTNLLSDLIRNAEEQERQHRDELDRLFHAEPDSRYPQQVEEPRPATIWTRVRMWFR